MAVTIKYVYLLYCVLNVAKFMIRSAEAISSEIHQKEFCEGETFRASCAHADEVILVKSAVYGRMSKNRCLQSNSNANCRMDVLVHFDLACSGRPSCEMKVSVVTDAMSGALQLPPCLRESRGYLEVEYTCLKVARKLSTECICSGGESNAVQLPATDGFLSSAITREMGCGSQGCPWLIRLPPGQHLAITLYDFAASTRNKGDFEQNIPRVCQVYAVIKDKGALSRGSETVCGSLEKQSLVFRSLSNEVEIRLITKRDGADIEFLLQYEVQGCADPSIPMYGWMMRNHDKAILGCNASADEWRLTCLNKQWVGPHINCSKPLFEWSMVRSESSRQIVQLFFANEWLTVAIIIAIALLIGVLIFALGFVIIKRRRFATSRYQQSHPARLQPGYSLAPYQDNFSPVEYVSKAGMMPPALENDYFRTWQLQQRHAAVITPSAGSTPSTPSAYNGSQSHRDRPLPPQPIQVPSSHHHIEHIYESPKFERRATSFSQRSRVPPALHCFEVDPEMPSVSKQDVDSPDIARRSGDAALTLGSFSGSNPM